MLLKTHVGCAAPSAWETSDLHKNSEVKEHGEGGKRATLVKGLHGKFYL